MLKIGEFAQEGKVSVKTLRYYDNYNLLKPAWKDRFSGYRYYHRSQLGELKRIMALKEMGFTLEQIQTILQEYLTMNQLRAMFILKQSELQTGIRSHQDRLEQIELQLLKLEELADEEKIAEVLFPAGQIPVPPVTLTDKEIPPMEVKIKTKPAFTVVGAEYHGKNENEEIKTLWKEAVPRFDEIQHVTYPNTKDSYGLCGELEDNGSFRYVAGLEVNNTEDVPQGMVVWEVPEQTYAIFPCTLAEIGQTYEYAHGTWMPQNGYKRADGPDFEYYDKTFEPADPKSLIYIYIPVKK
jgi:predicted transcriptional regulator YdeE/DNA-binding transcriptional MerR regulator